MNERNIKVIRGLLLIVCTVFIAAGIAEGGFTEVWNKAVMICTDCMGL